MTDYCMRNCGSRYCRICGDGLSDHAHMNIVRRRYHAPVPGQCDCAMGALRTALMELKARVEHERIAASDEAGVVRFPGAAYELGYLDGILRRSEEGLAEIATALEDSLTLSEGIAEALNSGDGTYKP